tara:strand:- start:613 stop:756 length:144 start_codon:yes stop_codon:yes gene_type:complete
MKRVEPKVTGKYLKAKTQQAALNPGKGEQIQKELEKDTIAVNPNLKL